MRVRVFVYALDRVCIGSSVRLKSEGGGMGWLKLGVGEGREGAGGER